MARPVEVRLHIPKAMLAILNQLCGIEQKLKSAGDPAHVQRNLDRIKEACRHFSDEYGLEYEDPLGQPFDETRADLEATIAGSSTNELVVVEVIKPIIRVIFRDSQGEFSRVVQKGIVVVEQKARSEQ